MNPQVCVRTPTTSPAGEEGRQVATWGVRPVAGRLAHAYSRAARESGVAWGRGDGIHAEFWHRILKT